MNLVKILQSTIQQSSVNKDIETRIAHYILLHINDKKISVNQIASGCYTSNATISRFFKEIGYHSFQEFQLDHQEFLIDRKEAIADFQGEKTRNISMENDFIHHNFSLILQDLTQYSREINLHDIDYLCDLINQKNKIHIYATGIPGNMTEIIQYHLLTVGKYVEYFPLIADQIKLADSLKTDDLAIFISLEGSHVMTKELTFAVTRSPAKSVLITQNPNMKFATSFEKIIALGSHSRFQSGKYKLLFFIEALLHHYFVKYINS